MAFDFKNAYNKVFAEPGTKLNRSVNKIIGKDVFKDIKTMDEPREFQPFDTFEPYNVPEPEQWKPITGESKTFPFQDNLVTVSANLDTCMQYVAVFKECAKYYADRFKFRYNQCITDYDSLLYPQTRAVFFWERDSPGCQDHGRGNQAGQSDTEEPYNGRDRDCIQA